MVVHVTVVAGDRDGIERHSTRDDVWVLFFVCDREAAIVEEMGDRLLNYTVFVGVFVLGDDDLLSLHRRRVLRDVRVGVQYYF